jgi:hypothetical protein
MALPAGQNDFCSRHFPYAGEMAPAWRPETRFSQKEPPPLDRLPLAVCLIGTSIWRIAGA